MHISSSLAWLICITVAASTSLAVRSISPRAIVSSNDGQYKLSNYTAPTLGAGNAGSINSTWSLSIDDTASGHKQQLTGFGAAVTDATVSAFSLLPAAQQTALLNDLFSPTKGIGFSLMRHTIAASDLSSDVYSYDNVSAPDVPLAHFNLTSEGSAMVTWLHRMRAINPAMRLLGSVWSPPGWMKLNGVQSGTTVNNNLNPVYSSSYAQYFVNYIKVFAARGVPVDAITIQNEPLNSQSGFPTMYVSAANSTHLIQKYVGPALKNASLATQIWAYDHNTDVPSYPQQVLDGAGAFVKTVAWHCYATNNDWGVLTNFSKANPGVRQYMTECWTSPQTPWYQSIDFVMGPLQNMAAGALAWTLGSTAGPAYGPHLPGGCSTCRGIVTVNATARTYTKTADYFFMGQFSRYLQRNATVLATSGNHDYGNGAKIESTAVVNADGSRTVVVQNGFGNDVFLTIAFKSGETWSGPLYQQSLTTWVLPPPSSV